MRFYDHFIAFCKEPMYADNGIYNIQPRKEVLFDFCNEGLVPFLGSKGYVLECNVQELTARCLRLLWVLSRGKSIVPLPKNLEYNEEHEMMYNYHFDETAWETFWNTWNHLSDFQQKYGERFKTLLPLLLWTWMNVPNCTMFEEIENSIYEDEDGFVSKRKDDPYLVDTSQVDYQDRHKF